MCGSAARDSPHSATLSLSLDSHMRSSCLLSQDPFELSHDLGRVMDRDTLRDVRSEIDRADVLLSEQRGNFAKLTLKFEEKKEQTRPEKQAKEAKAYKEKKEAKEADAAQAIAEQAVADLLLE